MRFSSLSVYLTAAAVGARAAPVIEARGVIGHDAVVGFPETVPSGAIGDACTILVFAHTLSRVVRTCRCLHTRIDVAADTNVDLWLSDLKFKPWLSVENGCQPYPAVDASGNTGGGLNPSGSSSSQCDSSPGQALRPRGRVQFPLRHHVLVVHAQGLPSTGLGHRHDWEGIVVWIDNPNTSSDPQVLGLSTSGHGDWTTITDDLPLDGTRPKIRYFSVWPVNHQLGTTDAKGGEQPLIAWESLTDAARDALQNTDFGDANVPFKDPNFMDNLQSASF
ncbi:25 kDa protein elicitor [Apiospora phragmitis]|uniref:25 kDa protein elicitor n=1 Tax=Apiospora phragmitis TaxID=2905665 RepID=A0ABR1TS03_9PEZI